MLVWYAGSLIAGCSFGAVFYLIFKTVSSYGHTGGFWRSMGQNIHGLLMGDEKRFWSFYGNIIRETLRYAGLQTLGVLLAVSPLIIIMMFLGAALQSSWNRGAPVTVTPPEAARLIVSTDRIQEAKPLMLALGDGFRQPLGDGLKNYVLCPTGSMACPVLYLFGFTTIPLAPERLDGRKWIIVRAHRGDRNPLWPYLNDPEFLFFLGISLSSMALMLRRKRAVEQQGSPVYDMSMTDYLLTWMATRYARALRVMGDLESRIMDRKTSVIPIEKPIFITGLARAGTTILLETLAGADGVATHRYRDFPFIMTPVFWSRFMSAFSGKQIPVERPHQDRIKITKESPEAFEEPIWQHFFPYLHGPEALHVLDADHGDPTFEKFYRDHIKKILLIRQGLRYLSKGNYNICRIEYIGSIFPDARFIVPVRHPLWHVESLVREHTIFKEYAAQNPQVPEYLKAVGHYEFGPQRSPVCLTKEGRERILSAWRNGDDYTGYAIQWAEIYRLVATLLSKSPSLAERIHVIRYEDLCSDPSGELKKIMKFVDLPNPSILGTSGKISPPSRSLDLSEAQKRACWMEVEKVAAIFGYTFDPVEMNPFSQASLSPKRQA